jgi:hypothetical protein
MKPMESPPQNYQGSGKYKELTRASSQDELSQPQYNPVAGSVDYGYMRDFERAEAGQSPRRDGDFQNQYEDFSRAGPVRP